MFLSIFKNTVLLFSILAISCGSKTKKTKSNTKISVNHSIFKSDDLVVGANQIKHYLPLLNGKRVGVVANQTSVIFKEKDSFFLVDPETNETTFEKQVYKTTHLVDSLLSLGVIINTVFAPEHGFRGKADAGEMVKDGFDLKTKLPIVSLYGKNKKPSKQQLQNIDVLIFDIQDVGARFYTYISTLHYVMEACAEQQIPLLILDRPNPNGHYVDGPVLEMKHQSFVGMHPVPVVHGMTIGEYAKMINGEGWLVNALQCNITVIPVQHYTHQTKYSLPIKPSPNLPNDKAINLYPSLCFFEGTKISAGRGTALQFQIIGSPEFKDVKAYNFEFTPKPNEGAKYPKHQNEVCYGYNLSKTETLNAINLNWLIEFYKVNKQYSKTPFFNAFFTKLAGTKTLQHQIETGLTAEKIKHSWQADLMSFKTIRAQYLIYD